MEYKMKDLGYPRTPTSAKYRVEMPDGSLWEVPVQVIADSRDEHYSDEGEDTIGFIRGDGLGKFEIQDWAGNNMNWSDVKQYATQVFPAPKKIDWNDGWANGEHTVVGEI